MRGLIIQLLGSLRGRYFVAAIFIALLLLATVWLAQQNVRSTGTSTSINTQERLAVLGHNENLRHQLWDAEYALHSFVINPSGNHRAKVIDHLDNAVVTTESLLRLQWIKDYRHTKDVMQLHDELVSLKKESIKLMLLRENIEELFPAMMLLRDVMTPNNKAFSSAVSLALEDVAEENLNPTQTEEFQLLTNIQRNWNSLISIFRGYVALLTGTFGKNNPDINQQSRNIELIYFQVTDAITELESLPDDVVSFQTRESLQQMREVSKGWYESYQQVKQVYASDHWRSDAPFLENRIHPLRNSIRSKLDKLDKSLETSSRSDVTDLATVSSAIIKTLWLVTAIILFFFVLGYAILSRTVLAPIARIASAFKREAFLGSSPELPAVSTIETQQLLDAFTEMRNQVQTRQNALEHQALHDALTELPNRTLLNDRLQQAITAASRDGHSCALFIMDLDRFKEINDTLGHQVGDQVLTQIGNRLRMVLRSNDTVARLGGDEFAVLLPVSDEAHAVHVAEKIIKAVDKPVITGKHPLYVGISIGISIYPLHGKDSQSLLQYADIAMYSAKRSNSGLALYDSSTDVHSVDRLSLVNELRAAISSNQLSLYYQPKYDITNNTVIGAEALLRWQHPELGTVSPEMIIELSEQTGLIKPLTSWVLDTALQHYSSWNINGKNFGISINLSTHNLQDNEILDDINTSLKLHNVAPECLELEITESAMMADPVHAKSLLNELHKIGIRVSIDDFGTGYSSLSYLKQLPVAELKIDKSFVIDMMKDENDAVIVRSTIDLAHNLGLDVVAEGVEHQDVLDILIVLGCDIAQGYLFSEPMPYEKFKQWLDKQNFQKKIAAR